MVEQAEHNSYKCNLITIEVESRGVVEVVGLNNLKRLLGVGRRESDTFLGKLAETAMNESLKIWGRRTWKD